MNRSEYEDGNCSEDEADEWLAEVAAAIRSDAGQAFLREMAAAIDAIPHRMLISRQLVDSDGQCCAIGAVCLLRGMDLRGIDQDSPECVAAAVGVPMPLVAEIIDTNDYPRGEDPHRRWVRMRDWIKSKIMKDGNK